MYVAGFSLNLHTLTYFTFSINFFFFVKLPIFIFSSLSLSYQVCSFLTGDRTVKDTPLCYSKLMECHELFSLPVWARVWLIALCLFIFIIKKWKEYRLSHLALSKKANDCSLSQKRSIYDYHILYDLEQPIVLVKIWKEKHLKQNQFYCCILHYFSCLHCTNPTNPTISPGPQLFPLNPRECGSVDLAPFLTVGCLTAIWRPSFRYKPICALCLSWAQLSR